MHSKKQTYQIRIEGRVSFDWSTSFEEVDILYTEDGQTVLVGVVTDQTALHGILMRIRDLGLSLVEVKRIERSNQSK